MIKVYDSELLTHDEQKAVVRAIGTRSLIPVPSKVYALGRLVGFWSMGRQGRCVVFRDHIVRWPAARIAKSRLPEVGLWRA